MQINNLLPKKNTNRILSCKTHTVANGNIVDRKTATCRCRNTPLMSWRDNDTVSYTVVTSTISEPRFFRNQWLSTSVKSHGKRQQTHLSHRSHAYFVPFIEEAIYPSPGVWSINWARYNREKSFQRRGSISEPISSCRREIIVEELGDNWFRFGLSLNIWQQILLYDNTSIISLLYRDFQRSF